MKLNTYRRTSAFTLVEIMIVVAIIGLLAAIAIPNFVRARTQSQATACINNLRLIDGAKQQWALENNQGPTAVPDEQDITPYLGRAAGGTYPTCPANGQYTIGAVNVKPTCSITTPIPHVLPD
ncbi:MAG: type II secretion system protein [Verrucomicrobiota bacterium]|nr:type II secretion system protein [Verrucomicrobiota bacterium]